MVPEQVREFLARHDIHTVVVQATDVDGVARGKRVTVEHFLRRGFADDLALCGLIFGFDVGDAAIQGLSFAAGRPGYPDLILRPDPATVAPAPGEPGVATVLCDVVDRDGRLLDFLPRTVLRTVVQRCRDQGWEPLIGYEFEFFLLEGTPEELAARGWRDPAPLSIRRQTYGVRRDGRVEEVLAEIRRASVAAGLEIESSSSEYGVSQYEVTSRYGPALTTADRAVRLKQTIKAVAANHGLTATFMAKLSRQEPGSSGHVHLSLLDRDGVPLFADDRPGHVSPAGGHFLAGLLEHLPATAAIHLPTINSYRRIATVEFSPDSISWGVDNRSTAVRAIPGPGEGARIEFRLPGADANPYLVVAACLAAGSDGLAQRREPPPPVLADAGANPDRPRVATSLDLAVADLERSELVRDWFGPAFVDHFATTRRWEVERARSEVTDWEIRRYLDPI